MRKVIVTGGDHHNTYGVIRALGVKNLSPFLLLVCDKKDSFLLRSKYLDGFEIVNSDSSAIDFLIKNKELFNGAVIIACSDGMSSAIDSKRNLLSDTYKLPGSKIEGAITSIMDKEVMSNIGREIGLNVPKSWIVESVNDICAVEFPCITKPILSKDGLKADIVICKNKQELIDLINTGSCYRYQVQKFIEKKFEYQLIGLSIDGGNEIIIPGISRCIRPCPGTNTGFLHYESLDVFSVPIEESKLFVRRTGYSGLFSIEFLRDKNGVDYFMEMNFRNDGNAICVTASGTNLPFIWYLANTNGDVVSEISKIKFRPVYVMPEFPDLECFVYTKKISIVQWIKDVFLTDTFMVFNIRDIKPFLFMLQNRLNKIIKKILHRRW